MAGREWASMTGGWHLIATAAGCSYPSAAGSSAPAPAASAAAFDAPPIASGPNSEPAANGPASLTIEPVANSSTAPERSSQAPGAAAAPAGQRPRADRTPTRPGDAEKITFDDLNLGMPADVVYREFMLSDRVKELSGKRVSIVGYMHGAPLSSKKIDSFVLLKNTQCKFGPGGQADHLTRVFLREGNQTNYTNEDLTIEGTLRVEPFSGPDDNTWAIYRLDDALVRARRR